MNKYKSVILGPYRKILGAINKYRAFEKFRKSILKEPVRIIIGASQTSYPGWAPTEIEFLNILSGADWARFLKPESVTVILAEHVWEHLSPIQGIRAAKNCYRYLRPGGHLRIAVPDGYHSIKSYIDSVRPGGTGPGAKDHKVLYNHRLLETALTSIGFKVRLLEYFDQNGHFHQNKWSPKDGMVIRSRKFDPRNTARKIVYTSLIVDAIKHEKD